jgi:hypothetical protein
MLDISISRWTLADGRQFFDQAVVRSQMRTDEAGPTGD